MKRTLCPVCLWPRIAGGQCDPYSFVASGRRWRAVTWGLAADVARFGVVPYDDCPDCGADWGGYHHAGCGVAECPRCGGQLLTCGCWEPFRVLRNPTRIVRAPRRTCRIRQAETR